MAISGTTRLVGIIGDPISGSRSPRMHNAAFAALGLDFAYVPLPVDAERVGDAVRGLVALGFAGANVTIPHKGAVLPYCDEVEPFAAAAESVNTIVIRDGRVLGCSTDTEALAGVETSSAAVVGAGGAARAWIEAIRRRGAHVDVFARRGDWPPRTGGADLVVQATPVKDALLFEPHAGQTVIDLAYNADGSDTATTAAARAAGCRVIDGLDVLARQGAAGFELWTGVAAPLEVMLSAVRG